MAPRGRPRLYATAAARQKAYRHRWAPPTAREKLAAEVVALQAQLAALTRKGAALKRKAARLALKRRRQVATDTKARARLADDLAIAEAHVRLMHEQLTVLSAANPDLAEANARRYANVQMDAQRRLLAELRDEFARLIAGMSGQAQAAPVPVRELITLCHPDRWSQGQPATELAHELMVRLNRGR